MFSGFDFGTSNCAIGVMNKAEQSDVWLVPIDGDKAFMPSVLYALERELICESVAMLINNPDAKDTFMNQRSGQLAHAQRVRRREDIRAGDKTVFVGSEAFEHYLDVPEEGYFVKSVKSFLGCSGLRIEAVQFFEDIVTAMMLNIKQRAEQTLGKNIDSTVIGRPVNFQGVYPEESNRRAIDILTTSAKRAGFKDVEFMFEPLAAGLDFESKLTQNQTVLVVDVGGGTTDCSMVKMGPDHRDKTDRSNDLLGHSGDRIGGNDFDVQLAGKAFMPLFGVDSSTKNGLPFPRQLFWDAVKTNDIGAQTQFNSNETGFILKQYLIDSTEPELISRFIKLRKHHQNHQLVRQAEITKISLSNTPSHLVNLEFIEDSLSTEVSRHIFADAVTLPIKGMLKLIDEVIVQAGCQPDVVYITGGTAKSQTVREAIETKLNGIRIIDGDHFGSVTKGLTLYAKQLFDPACSNIACKA